MTRCGAPKCRQKIPSSRLMCLKHWRMVPDEIKAEINKHYRAGQTIRTVTQGYLDAMVAAIKAVGRLEEDRRAHEAELQIRPAR